MISDIGAEALADALAHTVQLPELYLMDNRISDQGVQALAQTLSHATGEYLTYLKITYLHQVQSS